MIDFSTSKLGKSVQAIATEVDNEDSQAHKYSITSVKKTGGDNSVICQCDICIRWLMRTGKGEGRRSLSHGYLHLKPEALGLPSTQALLVMVYEPSFPTLMQDSLLAVVLSHAALPSETYWETNLPNTPMPKALRELLRPGVNTATSTVIFNKYGASKDQHQDNGKDGGYKRFRQYANGASKDQHQDNGKDGGYKRFRQYANGASKDQHQDKSIAFLFLEKDLHTNTKMNLQFTRSIRGATFLPHQIAEAIPFSINKFPQILNQFSINPKSVEAEAMKSTIKECEGPANKGEDKYCSKSLESMINFSSTKLGKSVRAIATEVDNEDSQTQKYSITSVKKTGGDKSVICHSMAYPYAVFYCHATQNTRAYVVPMVGADGKKVKAVAVCHMDTTTWNPTHMAFQVLKAKPGTPICHFLPQDHIVWVSK
ncbi:hypothetical protein GIB67_011124 [Kingdonia uniflora]|uniref:BURP domain-containing protein n=1 Tax=Kingdonia uniflora TaxID=39325 RepID=A0A7J7PA39_9MAGN|nr:hypothetical protein GIB67_011124 [Kingdonia uniflora]